MKNLFFIKWTLTTLLALLHTLFVSAQTNVSGDILSSTTWAEANSPYVVTGNVRVTTSATLTIEAGVTVRFTPQTRLDVEGQLIAVGTTLDSVFFESTLPAPDTGSWEGIKVNGSVGGYAQLGYAKLSNASKGLELMGTASGNHLVLENAEFRMCGRGLAGWQGTSVVVRRCGFKENHIGAEQCDIAFRRCAFAGNGTGILDSDCDVDSCTFTKHLGVAVAGGGGSIRNALFVSNTIGLFVFGLTPTDSVNGCQFAENDTAAVVSGAGVFFGNDFCANGINVRVASTQDVPFTGNCWCSTDTAFIATMVIDGRSNPSLGLVRFDPINTNCRVPSQVWPGDANDDGAADIVDVLYLGVGYGTGGPDREEASASWSGQSGLPWDLNFGSGPNYKHADCDGNGFIELADTTPILLNFGQVHQKAGGILGGNGIPVIFELPAFVTGGDTISINVELGDAQNPATGVYGLAFTLRPDTHLVRAGSGRPNLTGTWLGNPGSDLIDLDYDNGAFHWAVVRSNHQDVSGMGRMGGVTMIMIDDIARAIPTDSVIAIENVVLIGKHGDVLDTDVRVVLVSPWGGQITVYPNPANGRMRIALDTLEAVEVAIYNQNGQRAFVQPGPVTGTLDLDTRNLGPGLYYMRVTLPNGILSRKIFIVR